MVAIFSSACLSACSCIFWSNLSSASSARFRANSSCACRNCFISSPKAACAAAKRFSVSAKAAACTAATRCCTFSSMRSSSMTCATMPFVASASQASWLRSTTASLSTMLTGLGSFFFSTRFGSGSAPRVTTGDWPKTLISFSTGFSRTSESISLKASWSKVWKSRFLKVSSTKSSCSTHSSSSGSSACCCGETNSHCEAASEAWTLRSAT
mmetsp:Transcript_4167/g.15579  ORF Transcript_4167/g.15579 Transcript_4167/m.15579 type:complete len:211 (-) Transcript_4167:1615-2247(-)